MQTCDDRVWVVWARRVYGCHALFYKTSSNLGQSWSSELNLTAVPSEYENTKPSIVQTADGNIWVVWASNRPPPPQPPQPDFRLTAFPASLILPQNSSDASLITVTSLNNFSAPVTLWVVNVPENVSATLNPLVVTPPPDGTTNSTLAVSVGPTATPGNYTLTVVGKSQKSHSVNIDLKITASQALGGSSAGVSSPSEPDEAEDWEIYYRISADNGGSWSAVRQLTDNSVDDLSPSILQAANGTIFVFWQSLITGNEDLVYARSADNGASWSAPIQLTTDDDFDSSPSATQARDGTIWVAWTSERSGNWEIYCKSHDGLQWSADRRLTSSAGWIDVSPSIWAAVDGTLLIFWASCEIFVTLDDVYYAYSLDGGDTWSDPVQFTTSEHVDVSPAVTQTRHLKIWVVWASNRTGNQDLFYRTSLPGDITGPTNEPDGIVDDYDLAFVSTAYGDKEGDPDWHENKIADITGPEDPPASRQFPPDGVIDIHDLAIIGRGYGET